MARTVSTARLLTSDPENRVVLDVRSPAEYTHGHMPGAISFPLFSDAERAEVGTIYKVKGPEHAMYAGLGFVGPKMQSMIERAAEIGREKDFVIHCWRGGKRSESVGWLLSFAGFKVSVLEGGYKAYRTFLRAHFLNTPRQFIILGGETGSGKTQFLQLLAGKGQQVLDLEALANHKGSAFGAIGEDEQPTTEQFENLVFNALLHMDPAKPIWVENESRSIGRVYIPEVVWDALLTAPLIHLHIPIKARVDYLVRTYAAGRNDVRLREAFEKITKRLGGQHVKRAIEAIDSGDYAAAAEIALTYYDKSYAYGLATRKVDDVIRVDGTGLGPDAICDALLSAGKQLNFNNNRLSIK